jgi:hypothetical protein
VILYFLYSFFTGQHTEKNHIPMAPVHKKPATQARKPTVTHAPKAAVKRQHAHVAKPVKQAPKTVKQATKHQHIPSTMHRPVNKSAIKPVSKSTTPFKTASRTLAHKQKQEAIKKPYNAAAEEIKRKSFFDRVIPRNRMEDRMMNAMFGPDPESDLFPDE